MTRTKHAVMPPALREAATRARMSPAVVSGDHVFLTGVTGVDPGGAMPEDAETQFRNAFGKIDVVLAEVGLSLAALVEMTTYHVALREHFPLFDRIRLELVPDPAPAWTAVEVAGLRREGALVEIRAVATLAR